MKTRKQHSTTRTQSLLLGTSLLALLTACSTETPTTTMSGTTTPAATTTTGNTGPSNGASVIPQTNDTTATGSLLPAMSTGGLFGSSAGSDAGTGTGSTTGFGGSAGSVGNVPVAGSGGGASLTNGSSGQSMDSFWQCTGLTDTSTTIQFAWFADATGLISFDGNTAEITWDHAGGELYMTVTGDPTSVTFSHFSFLSDTEFQATFAVSGAGSAPLVCGLYDLSGNPLLDDGEHPVNDIGSGAGGGGGGSLDTGTAGSASVALLANDVAVSSGESMWYCSLSSGDDMGLYFESNGSGFYFDEDYPDGIDFLWDLNSTLDVSFSTGAYVSLSMPAFSNYNHFSIGSMVANGNQDLGSAECRLYDFDGLPL